MVVKVKKEEREEDSASVESARPDGEGKFFYHYMWSELTKATLMPKLSPYLYCENSNLDLR